MSIFCPVWGLPILVLDMLHDDLVDLWDVEERVAVMGFGGYERGKNGLHWKGGISL